LSTKTLYEILELVQTATLEDIKGAYRRQAMKWHPDRNPGNLAEAERRFKEIGYAYKILSDPESRAGYDAEIGAQNKKSSHTNESHYSQHTSSREDADSVFFDQMLDLAFELSRRGFDLSKIIKTLLALDCPEDIAIAVVDRLSKFGAKSKTDNSDQTNSGGTTSSNAKERAPRNISELDWDAACPFYMAYLGSSCDRYLDMFRKVHVGKTLGFFEPSAITRFFGGTLWLLYRKLYVQAAFALVAGIIVEMMELGHGLERVAYLGISSWICVQGGKMLYRSATRAINATGGLPIQVALSRIEVAGKPSHASWIIFTLIVAAMIAIGYQSSPTPKGATFPQYSDQMGAKVKSVIVEIEAQSPELREGSPNYYQEGVDYILAYQKYLMNQGTAPDTALWQAYQKYLALLH